MTERLEGSRETQRERKQEQGFVTPDGSASTRQRDREWAEALEAAGGIQIESFNPIEVINIAALQAKLKVKSSTPAAPETPPDRSEDFWINACLHILYCQKEWSKKCPVCHRIAEIVTAEKEAVVTGEFLETVTPRKEEAHEQLHTDERV